MLRRLVREEIDPAASERRRLVSALLLGGNVTVRAGSDRGGDFQHVRACRRPTQTGCVIAFSVFNAPVPDSAFFGRTSDPSTEILCTNPAALAGGPGKVDPIYPSAPFAPSVIGAVTQAALRGLPRPSTPWATFPNSYRASCSTAGGASVLQVRPLRGAFSAHAATRRYLGAPPRGCQHRARESDEPRQTADKGARLGSRPHPFVYGVPTRLDDWTIMPTILDMAHYLCPHCQDVVDFDGLARVTWCNACGQPLSMFDLLPVRPAITADPAEIQEDKPPALA